MTNDLSAHDYDVLILGGGPAGSTLGSLLKKYMPDLNVLIVEKEQFPREHVGESQLPGVCTVLDEMGCWNKVEAAGFPIKVGATYTWGKTTEPWDFEFVKLDRIQLDQQRPAKYEGWRQETAFQVERAIYDKILLDHAAELGCEVRQNTRADSFETGDDAVHSVKLSSGETVRARYYIDATGAAATLRRAMDVEVTAPTLLRNVAFWNYWDNAEWAEEIGVGATRVHIRSLPYGWIWFIPLGLTRTSIGVVIPASYYKEQKTTPAELYEKAVREEPFVAALIKNATSEGTVQSTKDWSFIVDRTYGKNWFLVGETAGFADPILAAGLMLTHSGARELAYTILELERDELDRTWLLERYNRLQIDRVRQHHRFAEYWYTANGYFDSIREHCTEIAKDAGLSLDPEEAFRWLSTGGFAEDVPGRVGVGGHDITSVKQVMQRFSGKQSSWTISGKNVFKLNVKGAEKVELGALQEGRIVPVPCFVRGGRKLALTGVPGLLVEVLKKHSQIDKVLEVLRAQMATQYDAHFVEVGMNHAMQALEVLAVENWVQCSVRKGKPTLKIDIPDEGDYIHTHHEDGSASRKQASAYYGLNTADA